MGLALRLARYGDPLFGDELSTLFVVRRSLPDAIGVISGDAEISPPLYFVFAWFSTKLGAAPELIRLPALIAGTLSIPLTYAVGARVVGRGAGLIAATVMALSPFMIFYSTDGRVYTLAIALLLGSTLAMLTAVEGGRRRWWIAYAGLSCLAMYAHYTSAFVLGAQLLWLAWAHRGALRAALLANVGAAALFVPWLPSALADSRSPTVEILEALQGSGFDVKAEAMATWAFGYPFVTLSQIPGHALLVAAIVALGAASVAGLLRFRRGGGSLGRPSPGIVLVLAIGLATPLAEVALLLFGGTDLLGARNLNTSSAGLALSIGAVLAAAGPLVGGASALVVMLTFGVAGGRTLDSDNTVIAFAEAAAYIDAEARPGDVVVDAVSALVTPVPLTPLDLYMDGHPIEFKPFLPLGSPPFLPFISAARPADQLLSEAVDAAQGRRMFVITGLGGVSGAGGEIILRPLSPGEPLTRFRLPVGTRLVDREIYPGLLTISIAVLEPG